MEAMTISQVAQQLAKAEDALRRVRARHGQSGRGGVPIDATSLIARNERRVNDWRRILAFVQED